MVGSIEATKDDIDKSLYLCFRIREVEFLEQYSKACTNFLSSSLTLLPNKEDLSSHNNIPIFSTSSLGLKLTQIKGQCYIHPNIY